MEIALKNIVDKLPVTEIIGPQERLIRTIVNLKDKHFNESSILWVSDSNIESIHQVQEGTVICSQKAKSGELSKTCTYLIVEKPRLYFLNLIKNFYLEVEVPAISAHSIIDTSVKIGKNAMIRAGVIIEKNCMLGDHVTIDSNTVIKRGTIIGNHVIIGANNTIGGVGFGYEKDEKGVYEVIPHIGNVVIEDYVEIGNNTTIDRAVMGSTILRKNAKVDNLVHIAHGVEIGENSLIIANSMIAGSTTVGKNVWVSPSASVLNKLVVGDNAVIGMGATVLKNVQEGQTVVGNPAKDIQSLRK